MDRWGGQGKAKRPGLSFSSATSSTYSHRSSNSSDDSEPAPENSATHMLPPTRAGAPSAAPPALHAAPPPLPADLAQMFDEPIGLDGALAAPPTPSAAPIVSSSSWLEQQELAEVLEEQLTGLEAIEVSKRQ